MYQKTIKLSGVTFKDAQKNIKRFGCRDVGCYTLVREPNNPHDRNAIHVELAGHFFGYVPRQDAAELAPLMDSGRSFIAYFVNRNEHPLHDIVGLTVRIVEIAQEEAA